MDEEWVSDEKSKARARRALKRIEERQEREFAVCPCGQRTRNRDGVCSKKTETHAALVAESKWRT